jgi:hypothetical protein
MEKTYYPAEGATLTVSVEGKYLIEKIVSSTIDFSRQITPILNVETTINLLTNDVQTIFPSADIDTLKSQLMNDFSDALKPLIQFKKTFAAEGKDDYILLRMTPNSYFIGFKYQDAQGQYTSDNKEELFIHLKNDIQWLREYAQSSNSFRLTDDSVLEDVKQAAANYLNVSMNGGRRKNRKQRKTRKSRKLLG